MMKLNTLFKATLLSLLYLTVAHGKGFETIEPLNQNNKNGQEIEDPTDELWDPVQYYNPKQNDPKSRPAMNNFDEPQILKKLEKKYSAFIDSANKKRKALEEDYKKLLKEREDFIHKYEAYLASTQEKITELNERVTGLDEKRKELEHKIMKKMNKFQQKRAQLEAEQKSPKQEDRDFSKRIRAEYNNGID